MLFGTIKFLSAVSVMNFSVKWTAVKIYTTQLFQYKFQIQLSGHESKSTWREVHAFAARSTAKPSVCGSTRQTRDESACI
jgi:hypothetical protein